MRHSLLGLGLAGCLTYEEGMAQQGEAGCALREACGTLDVVGYDDVDACIVSATAQEWSDCPNYDREEMLACLEAWEEAVSGPDCAVTDDPPAQCASVCL